MSKLHIIGVGGTGHKIVTAVVHLAACGAFKGTLGNNAISEIRILTIDADNANGNLTQAKTAILAYRDYYAALSGAAELGLVRIEPVSEEVNIQLFKEDKKSVNTAFNVSQYAGSDEESFIRFLYTDAEINEEFDHGFYGHTSIGTLIVKNILEDDATWNSQLALINGEDFVFVAGSIFGGTGASAIPVLLDSLQARKREVGCKLAALVLNPYFQTAGVIHEEGLLQPDSSNFNIKAKASLYYYYRQEQYKKTDALYIIGEPDSNYSVEIASRGASGQKNKAAPIELFAATALIDFIREAKNRNDSEIITAQRAYGGNNEYLYTWQMLHNILPGLPANMQTALKTAIFYNKVLYPHLRDNTGSANWPSYYDKALDKKKDDNQNLVYENIHEYLTLLTRWFYDIHKRNEKEVNQNTGKLSWNADSRVKLLNAQYDNLFNDVSAPDAKIENFDKLIYNDTNGKTSVKIYALLAGRPPAKADGFAALFSMLYSFIREEKKSFLGFWKKPPKPEVFEMVPYLAKENDVTFVRPDEPNKLWSKSQPTLLANIADGLPQGVSKSFTKNDITIPSPWSIFITNELTLTEQKFASINKAAFREWCGIIALLVLRKLCFYENNKLKLEPLVFGAGDGNFLRVVNGTLIPQNYLFPDPQWAQCRRLSLEVVDKNGNMTKETIAFLAHNTLVCPAYSLTEFAKTKLREIAPSIIDEKGEFLSPQHYFEPQSQTLNRDARYALKLFLGELNAIITREAAKNKSAVIGNLQNLTNRYIAELGGVTPNAKLAMDPNKKNAVDSVISLFEDLIPAPITDSSIELPFIMDGAKIPAALIGGNIGGIDSRGADAAHHRVTQQILYNQITPDFINQYKNTTRDGVKLIYADELLLDSMVMIKKDGAAVFHALPNNSGHSEYEVIWPLSDVLLELYKPDALNRMASFSADEEKITVSLKIKLKGKGGLGSHTVTKEYRIKNLSDMTESEKQSNGMCGIMEKNLLPFWSLWPYAKIHNAQGNNTWQRYNCYCVEPNYRGIPVLEIKPVFADGADYLVGERPLSTLQTVLHRFYYRRYKALPAAFRVNEKTEGAPIPRGFVFLAEPKTVNAGAVVWNVGVDFGTTSTTAFYTTSGDSAPKFIKFMSEYKWREGSKEPEKEEFDNDLKTLCDSSDKSSEIYFIDKQCFAQNGYATALEVMDTSLDSTEATIFAGERIFWHNHENFKIMNTQAGRKERLLTNIKWESNKSNSAKYLNQLLTQIVYQAAEKGVRGINFFFSYPTAFGPGAKDDFCGRVGGIIQNLAAQTGVILTFNNNDNLVTESIAASYYFNYKKPRQTVFFCVDIGGGSTDASIWVKTKHLFQTSIHLASRDMFITPMRRLLSRDSVFKAVTTGPQGVEDGIYTMLSDVSSQKTLTSDKFKFLIETVLFEYYEPLRNRLQNMQGQDAEAYKTFKYCVLIAYSGLMYYLAEILVSLLKIKDTERRIDNDTSEIILGLSGKGSKLTDWITSYCDIIYDEAKNLIKEKTSLEITIIPEFSPETAKTETAIGMICELDGDGRRGNQVTTRSPDVYLGCDIKIIKGEETKELRGDDFADVYGDQFFSQPKELKLEFDKELAALDSFIAFFNKTVAKTGNEMPPIDMKSYNQFKKPLWSRIKSAAEDALTKEGRFEPPFILTLKVFLEEYAEEYLWKK
jgi:hypothetical protein